LFRAAVCGDAPGLGDQRGVEEFARADEPLDAVAQLGGEEARVGGRQHRGEHPERVAGQLVCVDRPERRGHHRHRRRRVAQVVEADRKHAECGEQVGDVGKFARAADADRAVAFGGHPVQRAEPFGVGPGRRALAVHFAADLDERVIGRHLAAVEARQRCGEFGAQLPGFPHTAASAHLRTPRIQCGHG
jgi:hypothetical protein